MRVRKASTQILTLSAVAMKKGAFDKRIAGMKKRRPPRRRFFVKRKPPAVPGSSVRALAESRT